MNKTLFLQQTGRLCHVCGGAKPEDTCALRCERMVYETSRMRQYQRAWRKAPSAYNARRINQYLDNLAERARKAFVVKYYAEGNSPSKLWVVGRVA